jgi:hypothetical protein
MSLVGAMAGLFSWAVAGLISASLGGSTGGWVSDLLADSILGAFIGGLTVGFSDRWSGNRVLVRWIVSGAIICMLAGGAAGISEIPISSRLSFRSPILVTLISWMLAGSFIGLGLGMRWLTVNRLRVAHACVGGMLGGAIGGFLFAGLGARIPDLSQALGFIAVGVGICSGVTLAPILLRDGLLQFVSSGDVRAQSKFGHNQKQWPIQQGDSCTIGSQSQDLSKTVYRPEVEIYIPDAAIAPRHGILYGRSGRFFLARHPDIGGEAGLARYVLRVKGKTIQASQELRDADDILIGRTALKFVTKKKQR